MQPTLHAPLRHLTMWAGAALGLPIVLCGINPAIAGDRALLSLCLVSQRATAPHDVWTSWSFAPEVVVPLLLVLGLYLRGLMAQSGGPRTDRAAPWQVACFAAGWLALAIALTSPLCRLAATLVSTHMVQHVLLIAVAPLLLVLGRPMQTITGRALRPLQTAHRWFATPTPLMACGFYGAAIWLWHTPLLYQAALLSKAAHLVMYAVLIGAGLMFWRSFILSARYEPGGPGSAILSGLVTIIHTGLLGALLSFAPTPWYPLLAPQAPAWGLTALEDQQLAGLIMWVPMGLIYLVSVLAMITVWLSAMGRDLTGSRLYTHAGTNRIASPSRIMSISAMPATAAVIQPTKAISDA
jgi:cytochrome c oxidase assembly factor CtaG